MQTYDKPLPMVDEDTAPYWKFCRQHELRMQQCRKCSHIRFPPGILCSHCHSMDAEWIQLSGLGTVYSYVIYRQSFHPSWDDEIPYVLAIIQLREGPRMESNITGSRLDELRIGMPVTVYFDDVNNAFSLPKFRAV